MCNLYKPATSAAEIRPVFDAVDRTGNEPWPDQTYPNRLAPIIRMEDGEAVISKAKWGLPSPSFALKGKSYDRGVTNVRNLSSPHWRRWLSQEHRCLVPFTAFAEPIKGGNQWFELDVSLGFFAGLYVPNWTSVRKVKDGETADDLFGFLTCEPNELVKPIHPKAMPVILSEEVDLTVWLKGADAKEMQRPYPAEHMQLNATSDR